MRQWQARCARLWRPMLLATVLLMAFTSCARHEVVSHPGADPRELAGQEIRVTTLDGRVLEFWVAMVTPEAFVGDTHTVPFDEIDTLEVVHPSPLSTLAVVAGSAVGVTVVVAVAAVLVILAAGGFAMAFGG